MQKYNLKNYSGNPIDFPEFISNYYLTLAAYNIAVAEKIQKLVLCLKGSARDHYTNIFNENPPPVYVDWAAFKVAFDASYFLREHSACSGVHFTKEHRERGKASRNSPSLLTQWPNAHSVHGQHGQSPLDLRFVDLITRILLEKLQNSSSVAVGRYYPHYTKLAMNLSLYRIEKQPVHIID